MLTLKPAATSAALLFLLIACTKNELSTDAYIVTTNLKEDKHQIYNESLSQAESLIKAKKYREAELVLTREAQKNQNYFVVQSKLLYVNSAQAKINLGQADFLATGLDVEAGETALITLKQIVLDPESLLPKNFALIIKGQEDELVAIKINLSRSVDGFCNKQLIAADNIAKEAKSLITRNDRDKIVAGLVKIRECNAFGKWASVDTKGNSIKSLGKLLNLVDEKEHSYLLRSAGFGL